MALLNLHLKVWRQTGTQPGHFQDIEAPEIPDHASFLEMMDIVNERLIRAGQDPVAFDHDCREGICGMCSMTINEAPVSSKRRNEVSSLLMSSKCNPVVGSSKMNSELLPEALDKYEASLTR